MMVQIVTICEYSKLIQSQMCYILTLPPCTIIPHVLTDYDPIQHQPKTYQTRCLLLLDGTGKCKGIHFESIKGLDNPKESDLCTIVFSCLSTFFIFTGKI
jgi:hypothetical protein